MRLCALALCGLLSTGCALFSKEDGTEPVELVDFEPTAELDIVWRSGVGAGTDKAVVKLQPALDGDRIYAADAKGRVLAFNRENGKRLWQQKTDDGITGGVSSNAGLLLYGTGRGEVVALSSDDGEELWRTALSSEVISVPQTNGTIVAAQTMDGRLHALNAESGESLWRYDSPPPVLTLRGTASPLITDSLVIAGFSTGKVMAFDPDNGLVRWERRVALPEGRSEIERMVDVDASPLMVDGVVFAAAFQGNVTALGRSNGRPVWSQEASTHKDLAAEGRTLYLSEADSVVKALSTATGEMRWDNDQLLRRHINGPQIIGDYLAVGDYDGYLHLLKRDDGSFAARRRLDRGGISGTMVTDGDTLYVQTDGGRLVALEVKPRD